jgi:replicative DNA helicase
MALGDHLFKETELPLYSLIHTHVTKYGKIPSQVTIEGINGMDDAVVEAPEPPKFYYDEVQKRYLHGALKSTIQEVSLLLVEKAPEAAMDVMLRYTASLYKQSRRASLFDFREAEELIHQSYMAQKLMGSDITLPYGWPTLDEMSGGMRGGDFVTFVGRPMAGKTFKLLYTALNAWNLGRTPLFVSMEMLALIIQQRLTAMQTHKKLTDLLKAELSTQAYKDMMLQLRALKAIKQPLWVLDSNLASTVDDILQYVMLLNPSCLFVDGGYLLDHPDKKFSKWDKQAENARLLKQIVATDLQIPVVVSYQLGKASAKAKKKGNGKGEADGMEDVYGSDEMAQLSTVMLGLYDNEANVEAKKKRTVKILKGRNGETGQFDINWDFSAQMNFSEIVPEDPHTMQMDFLG